MNGPRAGLGGMTGAGLLVVGTYCLATITVIVTICALSILEVGVPVELKELGTVLVGGVGLLLAKTWADKPVVNGAESATPVEVIQPKNQPIPVVEAPRSHAREEL